VIALLLLCDLYVTVITQESDWKCCALFFASWVLTSGL
jgi:hypothetical protein